MMLNFIVSIIAFLFLIFCYFFLGFVIIGATIDAPTEETEKTFNRFLIIWILWLPIIIIREGILLALEQHDRNNDR